MTFETEQSSAPDNLHITSEIQLTPALKTLKDDALTKIADVNLQSRFNRTFDRAVQDAEQCLKMRINTEQTDRINEELPLVKMKRGWGEEPKDGLEHYEQVCKEVATKGFLASGFPQNDVGDLVRGIFLLKKAP